MLTTGYKAKVVKTGLVAACVSATLCATVAKANTVIFTLDDGANSGSFAIDTHANPGYSSPGHNVIMPIINTTGTFSGDVMVQFFVGGDFTSIYDDHHYYSGLQLYSGSEFAPIFEPGVYTGLTGGATGNATLTITNRAPAPLVGGSSLAALAAIAGFALSRLGMRRLGNRKRFGFTA